MKTEHTPGPWKDDGNDGKGVIIVTSQWGSVARVMIIGCLIQERANARLIAAAPELLATAIESLEMIQGDPSAEAIDTVRAMLASAIAKATGV